MDPNETLKELRLALSELDECDKEIGEAWDEDSPDEKALADLEAARLGALEGIAELTRSLDEWLTKGGFLPKGWRR